MNPSTRAVLVWSPPHVCARPRLTPPGRRRQTSDTDRMQLCGGGCRLMVPNVMTFSSSCNVFMSMLKPDAREPVRSTRPSSAAWALDLHTNDTTERAANIQCGESTHHRCRVRGAELHRLLPRSRREQLRRRASAWQVAAVAAAGGGLCSQRHQRRERDGTYQELLLDVLCADSDVVHFGSTGVALARQ